MKQIEAKEKKVLNKKEILHLLAAYCSKEERCEYDVLQKIASYGTDNVDADEILKYLIENKYVDNNRYAAAFVNDKFRFNKWGRIKISVALKQKKIPAIIIQDALAIISEDDYLALLTNEIKKKEKSVKASSAYEKKSKLYRFAASRGFEMEAISQVLGEI